MKILVVSQYYYPEPFKIHEICEELVQRGHEVTVVTGRPNYPDGSLYSSYDEEGKMHENINGVEVIRTKIALRGNNPISLIRNYFSFPRKAKKVIKTFDSSFDVVYVYQLSPVFMINPAIYYKKKYNKPLFAYCLDLWPESLKVLHISENNFIYKIIKKMSNTIYQNCDRVGVTSLAFKEYLNNVNGVEESKISWIPQHGENFFLNVKPYKKQEKVNITFAGNIGKAQDFDTLIEAVKLIPEELYERLKFTIIGSGSYLETFINKVKENKLDNIFYFVGRKKVEELLSYFDESTLFLLSLEKGSSIGKTIPSKLQTYMAAGRGIIGSIDGETNKIVKESNSGIVCEAGNANALSEIIKDVLNKDDEYFFTMSKNSRNYFQKNFTLENHIVKLTTNLEEVIDESI